MDYKELFEKYQALLVENNNLKEEVIRLKAQLGIVECQVVSSHEAFVPTPKPEMSCTESKYADALPSGVNNMSDSIDKIRLFMSLFRGREMFMQKDGRILIRELPVIHLYVLTNGSQVYAKRQK